VYIFQIIASAIVLLLGISWFFIDNKEIQKKVMFSAIGIVVILVILCVLETI
jgi:hypothetical protein